MHRSHLLLAALLGVGLPGTTFAQQDAAAAAPAGSFQPDAGKRQDLRPVPNVGLKVLASVGASPRAALLAARLNKAYAYFNRLLGYEPAVAVLVLSAADHKARYATEPYGLPFYRDGNLVLPADASPALAASLRQFSPPPEELPRVNSYYELLPVYELARAYRQQRRPAGAAGKVWLEELLAVLMQYAYFAQNEPGMMPAVETVPRLLASRDTTAYPHRSLTAFAGPWAEPRNEAWYRAVLGTSVPRVYQTGGLDAIRRLDAFLQKHPSDGLLVADAGLAARLQEEVSPAVATIITTWPVQ